jgi:hypothetical protein
MSKLNTAAIPANSRTDALARQSAATASHFGMSEHERREAATSAALSLGRTHVLVYEALWVPCPTHDKRPGTYCWGSVQSGVRGICRSRIARGMRDANKKGHMQPQPSVHAITITALPVPPRRVR